MSYLKNTRTGPGSQITTGQLSIPSSSIMNPYQPRTPMVYSQSSVIPRNHLTESEPLSPYSEMQVPMTPMRPAHQLNPMSIPYVHSQEVAMKPQISPYPKTATFNSQNTSCARMMETRPQRMGPHDIQTIPYGRSSYTPQPKPSLLPHPTPQHYVTSLTPSYNPDQCFIMQSTSSGFADRIVSSNARKTEGTGLLNMNSNNVKTTSQANKQASVSRKRFLVGSIDQIVHWNQLARKADLHAMYEVTGVLQSMSYNSRGKVYKMILRDDKKNNSSLQAVFFPIDRDIPEVRTGGLITLVGRMIGSRKIQVLNMWSTNADSLAGLKRISFLCQRTLQEACLSAPEP